MEEKLGELGLNKKEIEVYIYLVNFGLSSASEIARTLEYPKSSINFLADNLWKIGFVKKSFRGKTGYYETDVIQLEKIIQEEIKSKKNILDTFIPELKEKTKNTIERPKIIFIDGVDNCKKAYLDILKTKNRYLEIGAHGDLVNEFGEEFMDLFIQKRVKNNLTCDAISNNSEIEKKFKNLNVKEKRELLLIDERLFGRIHSTIAIYDNKVLILNLNGKSNGVIIENEEFYETMKTIFMVAKKK